MNMGPEIIRICEFKSIWKIYYNFFSHRWGYNKVNWSFGMLHRLKHSNSKLDCFERWFHHSIRASCAVDPCSNNKWDSDCMMNASVSNPMGNGRLTIGTRLYFYYLSHEEKQDTNVNCFFNILWRNRKFSNVIKWSIKRITFRFQCRQINKAISLLGILELLHLHQNLGKLVLQGLDFISL